MLIAQRPTLTEETITESRSRFVIEPLEPGFGYTLGNSLRRTLLSSIPGSAISSVKIEGVLHEFSTIDGVTEDVTDIVLNVKQMVLRSELTHSSLTFMTSSTTSSLTPGIVVNTCSTPSTLMDVTAAPGMDDSSVRRRELPSV